MKRGLFAIIPMLCCAGFLSGQQYRPDWKSLDTHPVPDWFTEAKFGIFIHWGVYSVPAYRNFHQGKAGTYAEWYGPDVMYKPWRNDDFHRRNYGEDFTYRDFGPLFRAELWDPSGWADIFRNSGARYVVLTAKHHDGYCLWPTADPHAAKWNSMDTGPGRDLVGDLARAVRSRGLKFGVYYSLLEWESTRTTWPHDERYADERTGYYVPEEIWQQYHIPDSAFVAHLHFQLRELVERYSPALIFADGAWDYPDTYWKSKEFLAWLYNNAPNKREVLVNDRWGSNTTGLHGDYFTSEYNNATFDEGQPWEESRGMGYSYGFNRAEQLEDYKSADELIEMLCRTVCRGGNLLLNVGPTADGRIPLLQQERLAAIGHWLDVNGDAIYDSDPFPPIAEGVTCTRKKNSIFAFVYDWNQTPLRFSLPDEKSVKNCILLGQENKLAWKQQGREILIIPPVLSPDHASLAHVYVFEIELMQ